MKLNKKQMNNIENTLTNLLTHSKYMERDAYFLSGAFYLSLKEKHLLKEEPCNDLITLCRQFHSDNEVNQFGMQELAKMLGFDELKPEDPMEKCEGEKKTTTCPL